ncbi:HlyD family secretion protein [Deferrisoma camini]|uniref:HlyD family secretion protein n=1 Tax=Deferrisoma camini TaxID=1035120 RepID=UPI0004B0897B|nr:HlyD family secretion protein [Deferrisoma camini]
MRLTKLRPQVRTPSERERRRISVGKVIYFGVLVLAAAVLFRLGFRKLWYIEGKGFVRGASALVQTVDRGRILWSGAEVGRRVEAGEVLARLGPDSAPAGLPRTGPEEREAVRAEVRRLEARARDERRQEAQRIARERQTLEDRTADRERRLAVLEAEAARRRAAREAAEQERARWRRLYELEAISLEEYLKRAPPAPPPADDDAELQALRAELARLRERLRALGARSPRASEETRARLADARRRAASLAAGADRHGSLRAETVELRSPLGGVVGEVFRRTGEVLREGEALARVVDPGSLLVEAWFPPAEQPRLRTGTRVTLVFATGATGAGRIEHVDPTVTDVPPEYQKRYEPLQRAVRITVRPDEPAAHIGALDAKVAVRIPRFAPTP